MKKYVEIHLLTSIFIAALLVVATDAVIMPVLLEFYLKASATIVFVYDFARAMTVHFFADAVPFLMISVITRP